MARFSGEHLVRTKDDRDLGRLELWSWPRPRGALDFMRRRGEHQEWRGRSGSLPFYVGVDSGCEPDAQLAFLDSEAIATIASLEAREPALRHETAKRALEPARDWSDNPKLSEAAFADSLRASEVAIYTDASNTIIDLFFEDTANIFAGHIVLTSLDKSGNIISTGIEG